MISELSAYRKKHVCKILGAGIARELHQKSPNLCSRLWAELDIVPFVVDSNRLVPTKQAHERQASVDEIADSAARKCLAYVPLSLYADGQLTWNCSLYAPTKQPRLSISYQNQVEVDMAGVIQMTTVDDYRKSVREPTWRAVQKYIKDVADRKLRIVYFSATPQGGGVALMRHALLRFLVPQNVHIEW